MLRISDEQYAAIGAAETRDWAERARPSLLAEFGADAVAAIGPLEEVARAADSVGLDEPVERYRFARALCALSALAPDDPRLSLVARCATRTQAREERLTRMERTALGARAALWTDHPWR